MSIGDSGRVVLEIDPQLKRRLYSVLALEHQSLKQWFIGKAEEYVQAQQQPSLFGSAAPSANLDTKA
jgi:hypothetical protein